MRLILRGIVLLLLCASTAHAWQPEGWIYVKWNRWYSPKDRTIYEIDFKNAYLARREWYYNIGYNIWNDLDEGLFEDVGWVYFSGHFARHPSYGWIYIPYNGDASCRNLLTGEVSEFGQR